MLQPYATCNKYNNLKEDPKTYAESVKYMNSPDYLAVR